jgi:hypothetical protein
MYSYLFDSTVYKLFKNKWELEEDRKLLTYKVHKLVKLRFNEDKPEEVIIMKYPSHYKHLKLCQYNFGFAYYFGFLAISSLYVGIRSYYKRGSIKTLIALSIISFTSMQETYLALTRVKDVKSLIIKDGKTLVIETFQDEDKYETDLKNIRVSNKNNKEYLMFVDTEQAKRRDFRFYMLEPCPGTVYNLTLFETVMLDQRYINY